MKIQKNLDPKQTVVAAPSATATPTPGAAPPPPAAPPARATPTPALASPTTATTAPQRSPCMSYVGPVLKKGDHFYVCGSTILNHADYMDRKGSFDICQFYENTKFLYPGLANTFLGKLGHHSYQEADCETLFSIFGYKSDPRRLVALIRTYEHLVIASHRMHRFHIRDKVVIEEYMKRYKNNDWDEEECRDDEEFLKVEEEMLSSTYPGQASASAEEDEVRDEVTSDSPNEGDNLSQWFDGYDNTEVMNLPILNLEIV